MRSLASSIAAIGVLAPFAAPAQTDDGAMLWQQKCAACHGETGAGDGPMAMSLTLAAPDLRDYVARAGGNLPVARTVAIIEGDAVLRGHGSAMPAFDPVAGEPSVVLDAEDGSPIQTSEEVAALILYLKSLQR